MDEEVDFYVRNINVRKAELQNSTWFSNFVQDLEKVAENVDEIRCLALGSISDFVNPRFQLALLLLLIDKLKPNKVTAWDPIFTASDKLVLSRFNIEIQETDPKSNPSLLWYVPHGPFSLVLDLPSKLGSSIYIGNDLTAFSLEDKPEVQREIIEQYKAEARIFPIKTSRQDRWYLAFSTTAIHKRI